jgi:superfamily II DNA/RNA helicase
VTRAETGQGLAPPGTTPPNHPARQRRRRGRKGTTISILTQNDNQPESPTGHSPHQPTFAELGVLPETVEALDALGITSPFPIQAATIPVALGGSDVIGQAKTGTGKTLAFGIPVLQRVSGPGADPQRAAEPAVAAEPAPEQSAPAKGGPRRRGRARGAAPAAAGSPAHGAPQALVVVPTRELAVQVANDLTDAGKVRAVRVHALYGGRSYEPQVAALRAGIDVAVGTPGRLLDLARQDHLDLSQVRTLVLDEADEMLDLGFLPDVERIVAQLPADRQTLLFSATMPGQVISLARRYMVKPTHIRASDPDDAGLTVANIANFVYRAHSMDKLEMLARILQADGRGLAMIFARTKRTVAKIAEDLADRHFAVAAVHGDLGQGAREQALRAFRNGKVDVLVATDVAARGIDVEGVTHVVNFQCPEDEKVYTHRTGRTGRAGAKGIAVTFVDWDEVPRWQLINKALGLDIPDPAELYSTSPQLYSDLGIPTGAKGVLPKLGRVREGLDAEQVEDLGETGRSRAPRAAVKAAPKQQERPERAPRQRRRTRGGGEQGAAVQEAPETVLSASADVVAPAAEDRPARDGSAEPRKRTRTRKTARPAIVPETVELATEPATVSETPVIKTPAKRPAVTSALFTEPVVDAPQEKATQEKAALAPVAEPRQAKRSITVADAAPVPTATQRPKRTRGSAAAGGGSIKLTSGSLADPRPESAGAPVPVVEAVVEPVTRTPRKRAAKKPASPTTDPAAAQADGAASDPAGQDDVLNAGPVANPRRTQLRPARTRKTAGAAPKTSTDATS